MDLIPAFLLGLVGSLHCAGMCGPLALALPRPTNNSTLLLGRLSYNGGRLITYCLLGVLFGLLGKTLFLAGVQRFASIALGSALLVGLLGSRHWVVVRFRSLIRGSGSVSGRRKPGPVSRTIKSFTGLLQARWAALLRRPSFASLVLLGMLNGLLPCGLVYVAGVGATATGDLLPAVAFMALFGLGTIPMLLAIGLFGNLIPFSLRLKLRPAIPVAVLLLGSLLILRGLSLGIPYLSPDLSKGTACCH